jgi:voltage-gated potassium channel
MSKEKLYFKVRQYRFEFLLIALILLLFDKIFFFNDTFFLKYIWPLNMVLLSITSFGLFLERKNSMLYKIRNYLAPISILLPIAYGFLQHNPKFMSFLLCFFLIYYSILFVETFAQIVNKNEVTISVVLGSICGYLLLIIIATFTFISIEYFIPHSFSNITYYNASQIYNEIEYYTIILITSTGFGDILPLNHTSRLASSFFAILSQFYIVALVGIIISKFTTK